ncbi:TonB-dependent receptor plug domain-containing protein [Pedobacter aquatilis]|uniref:TonB-dependent receptor plug domain-containing protein n=1 Tax=Pedobacter aquatilis TaxID=351343 RepID=UPI002931CC8B|nr:TonB-dependent receptor plug domain-containing protein [Pedobacter aquatilis]
MKKLFFISALLIGSFFNCLAQSAEAPAESKSGISLNNNPKIIIRGLASSKLNEPVYVVDGQKIEKEEMNSFDQSKIESIVILRKDNTSIALYGPQASNGVVIITTKLLKKPKTPDSTSDKN